MVVCVTIGAFEVGAFVGGGAVICDTRAAELVVGGAEMVGGSAVATLGGTPARGVLMSSQVAFRHEEPAFSALYYLRLSRGECHFNEVPQVE